MEKRSLTKIIFEAKKEYNVPNDVLILETTVRQRLKRNSKCGHCGLTSPMIEIEPYIGSIIIQLANICVPISSCQGLSLYNSIVNGTKFQELLEVYKEKALQNLINATWPIILYGDF